MYKGHGLHSVHQVVGGQCVKSKSATLLATDEIQIPNLQKRGVVVKTF